MYRYTRIGTGDFTPDYPEDNRPVCMYCGEHFSPDSGETEDQYCNASHWHLDNIGEVKCQILLWIECKMTADKIIDAMNKYWFYWMTDSTVERWKRAIKARFDVNELAKAA